MMETLRLSQAAYQLIRHVIEAREHIGHELERYNDRREREKTEGTNVSTGRDNS